MVVILTDVWQKCAHSYTPEQYRHSGTHNVQQMTLAYICFDDDNNKNCDIYI